MKMFKYTVLYSVLAVAALTQGQPIENTAAVDAASQLGRQATDVINNVSTETVNVSTQTTVAPAQTGTDATVGTETVNVGTETTVAPAEVDTDATVGTETENVDTQTTVAPAETVTPAGSTITNNGSQAVNALNHLGQQAVGVAEKISNHVQQQYAHKKATLGQLIDRLGEAAKLTVIEEKESIAKAIKSLGNATGHTFKAGLDVLGTGFDMILIVPKFAFNALGNNKTTNVTL